MNLVLLRNEKLSRALRLVGVALTLLSLYILAETMSKNIGVLGEVTVNLVNINYILFGMFVVLFGHFLLSYTWYYQLQRAKKGIGFRHVLSVIGQSQIAKYLPGNFAHLLGRAILVKKEVPAGVVAVTLVVESLILTIAVLLLFLLWLALGMHRVEIDSYYLYVGLPCLILVCVVVFGVILKKLGGGYLGAKVFGVLLAVDVFSFFIHGLAIFFILAIFDSNANPSYLYVTCGFAISFIVGYLVPGSPGGIGVREYAFVLLTAPALGEASALQAILTYRVISMVGDALFWFIAWRLK